MIVYNQAFDLYHTIFRLLHFLNKFEDGAILEVERVRIWDFYFLFPNKTYEIRLRREEADIRKLRRDFIKKTNNPYDLITENRKVFDKIKPYQLAAFNCIASYNIIDKDSLNYQRIRITNHSLLQNFVESFENLSNKEKNIIALMTSHFNQVPLFGSNGLRNRTNLFESKYDA